MDKVTNTTKLKHWTLAINDIIDEVNTLSESKADNNKVVHTTGDETLDGSKTFKKSIVVSANPLIQSTPWTSVAIEDESRTATFNWMLCNINDKNGKRAGGIELTANADGSRHIHYSMRNRADTGWLSSFQMKEDVDGKTISTVNNPDENATDNEVATASWVLSKISKSNPTKVSDLENDLDFQTKTEVDSAISKLVGSAPETLDTLNELATALGNDPNFATTVANQIGTKANNDEVVKLSGNQTIGGTKTFSSTISGSINGNAGTATTLKTARTINGTSFNGSANITTANWGKARTFTITDGTNDGESASVNGSANVTLSLPTTIIAETFDGNLSGNATTATTATKANQLTTARTIGISGAVTGTATSFNGTSNITIPITALDVSKATAGTLPIARGGTGRTDGYALNVTEHIALKSRDNIGYVSSSDASSNDVADRETLAWWNGAYSDANSSNLTYCANGTIVGTSGNQTIGGTKTFSSTISGSINGNAGTATTLKTARTIDGVSFNGSANITHFGTCSTAANTAAKVVSCSGFTLATGARITVRFSVTNTASSPTLNVNNTGAKAIHYRSAAITAGYLAANRVYEFVYDGTNYELVGDIDTNTNTDTKVTQTVTTTNAEYALLTMADAAATATKTNGARFASSVTLNPSTKKITCAGLSGTTPKSTWVDASKSGGSLLDYPDISDGAFAPFVRYKTTNGAFVVGGYKSEFGFYYLTDTNIDAGTNTVAETVKINESGVLSSTGGFSGNLTGNASTATTATKANQLTTARTIAIGGVVTGTATSFNGTANITIDTTKLNLEDGGISGELPTAHGGTGRTDGKAVGLATARTIDGVSFNGTANISHFGTCSTAAATAAKVVSCTGFTLAKGARIIVQFTVTNTAASPTLNVNSTGAKAITYRNAAISAGYLAANRVYEFVYDGTNYELVGDINTDTNTDTKVTQTVTTTDASYPILITNTASATATKTEGARFCSGVSINPADKSITASGPITGSAVYNAVWNDYAEFFPRGEETEPGDIIALDITTEKEQYVKAGGENTRIVGVHSDTFGHLIGGEKNPEGTDFVKYNMPKFIPIGLAGRVRVKCTGLVKKGDYIVLSDIRGVGRAYDKEKDGFLDIIGIACEQKTTDDISRLLVKIK